MLAGAPAEAQGDTRVSQNLNWGSEVSLAAWLRGPRDLELRGPVSWRGERAFSRSQEGYGHLVDSGP